VQSDVHRKEAGGGPDDFVTMSDQIVSEKRPLSILEDRPGATS
jgi:hypothetical protein